MTRVTSTGGSYTSRNELPKSVILLLVQLAVSAVVVASVMMETFSVAGCDDHCDYGLVSFAFCGTIAIAIGALIVSTVIVAVRGGRRAPSWWAPAAASALIVAIGLVAVALVRAATAVA